jgi:hypothetical protein
MMANVLDERGFMEEDLDGPSGVGGVVVLIEFEYSLGIQRPTVSGRANRCARRAKFLHVSGTFHKAAAASKIRADLTIDDGGSGASGMEDCSMDDVSVDGIRMGRPTVVARVAVGLIAIFAGVCAVMGASGNDVSTKPTKRTIGATAMLTEMNSGIAFPARIDTGAETCSLHVEKIEIQDKTARRTKNVGKSVRFLLKANDNKTQWVEGVVADAVRVKSSSLKSGDVDHRYKVRLTLQWKDVRKEVLVTLNDRTSMEYPLLIGRNFLQGDFVVDVDTDKDQSQSNPGG